jgi:hypothetical protein
MLIRGRFCLRVKVRAWYVDPNGIETKLPSNILLVSKRTILDQHVYEHGLDKIHIVHHVQEN